MSQKDLSGFGNRFSVGRATAGSTTTTVNENVQVLGTLAVGSNLSSGGNLSVTGTTSLGGVGMNSLNVNSGKSMIDSNGNIVSLGNLSLAGVATLNSLYARGDTSLASLTTSGNASVGGTLGVTGATSLSSLTTSGNTSVGGTLGVTGTSTLAGVNMNNLDVNSGKTMIDSNGNIVSLGNLSLAGVATLNSLYASGTLGVTGASTLAGVNMNNLNINSGKTVIDSNGNISSLGNIGVGGAATFSGTLDVVGNTRLNELRAGITTLSALTVNGNVIANNGGLWGNTALLSSGINVNTNKFTVDSNGNVAAVGTMTVGGAATFSSLNATGAVSVGGNATMLGPLYANNGINVNTDKLTIDSNGNLSSQGSLSSQTNISAIGGLSVGGVSTFGNSIYSSSAVYLNSLNVNGGKFSIDSQGNVLAAGTLSVTGNATFSNIAVTGTATVAGNLNMTGNISANGSLSGGSLAVNTNKFTIDANGNVVAAGTLGVTGNTTLGGSVNVQSGKFVVDSSGNVGIGSTPSGAVMDIYNNSSRIRMRGTGTGIEWNNTGSAVLSSLIYDTDSKLKMYSSATNQPKMSLDSNNVVLIHDPSTSTLTSARHTAITPVGILTVAGVYTVNVSQSGATATLSGTDASALITYLGSNKAYLYADDSNYRNRLLFPTVSGGNVSFVDVLTGSAVTLTASVTDVKVYAASAVVTNSGAFMSASLVTSGNPQVVVSNQYGQLGLSA